MKILLNAVTLKEGGGLIVLQQLLGHFVLHESIAWFVIAPIEVLATLPNSKNIIKIPYETKKPCWVHLWLWYEVKLTRLLLKIKPDVLFSLTNFLPRFVLGCPTLLLVHHAGYFCSRFKKEYNKKNTRLIDKLYFKMKNKQLIRSIYKATTVTVQTQALAQEIISRQNCAVAKVVVIPHGTGQILPLYSTRDYSEKKTCWRIGYITKYGVQKDFKTALGAIHLLKKEGFAVQLIITLAKNASYYPELQQRICQYNINNEVKNYGEISHQKQLAQLYNSLDIFIYPSFCESFGFSLLEAMAYGLPVIVSQTKSNLEITQADQFFPVSNALALAHKIKTLITDKELFESESLKSWQRAALFSWSSTAEKIVNLLRNILSQKNN